MTRSLTRPTGRLVAITVSMAAVLLLAAAPALAHRSGSQGPPPPDAIAIPSLTHGQMVVMARHLAAVRTLAEQQVPTDPTLRRLQGYVSLQTFACLWGLVPGTLTDEDSPFNECAHAYLAAARMLLAHLQGMPGPGGAAAARLVESLNFEMAEHGAAFVTCRYSGEPFSTADVVTPHWEMLPSHAPSALSASGALLLLCGGASWAVRRGLRAPKGAGAGVVRSPGRMRTRG